MGGNRALAHVWRPELNSRHCRRCGITYFWEMGQLTVIWPDGDRAIYPPSDPPPRVPDCTFHRESA